MVEPMNRPLGAASGEEPAAPPPTAHQVCGEFHDKRQLDAAMSRLEGSYFQHADLSVRPLVGGEPLRSNVAAEEPMRRDEARNLRQLAISLAAVVTGMVAAGVVVISGGGMTLAAIVVAVAALLTFAGAAAVGIRRAPRGDTAIHRAAQEGEGAVLLVHAATPEKRGAAARILEETGAARVWQADSA